MLKRFWQDDDGALIATEWVFVVTILVIGLVVGLKSVNQAINTELEGVANAVGSLSQSYSYGGTRGCCSSTSGSRYFDTRGIYQVNSCQEVGPGDEVRQCPD